MNTLQYVNEKGKLKCKLLMNHKNQCVIAFVLNSSSIKTNKLRIFCQKLRNKVFFIENKSRIYSHKTLVLFYPYSHEK